MSRARVDALDRLARLLARDQARRRARQMRPARCEDTPARLSSPVARMAMAISVSISENRLRRRRLCGQVSSVMLSPPIPAVPSPRRACSAVGAEDRDRPRAVRLVRESTGTACRSAGRRSVHERAFAGEHRASAPAPNAIAAACRRERVGRVRRTPGLPSGTASGSRAAPCAGSSCPSARPIDVDVPSRP